LFDWCYKRGATDCGEVDITYRGSHSKTRVNCVVQCKSG
jgi:hypothetical protein